MMESYGRLWVQNWYTLIFPVGYLILLVFLHNCCDWIRTTWLFRTYFHIKIFSKYNIHTHYNVGSTIILIKSLKFRKQLWNYSDISHWSTVEILSISCFLILYFAIIFLQKRSSKAWLKMTVPKNKSMQKFLRH